MVTMAVQAKPSSLSLSPPIYRIGNTDRFGCENCRVKGDKWAMQDHNCSSSLNKKSRIKTRSKVEEMAEANESGNGVMFGNQKEPEK
jgi:hypothetical protein